MTKRIKAISFVILSSLLAASAQIFLKFGADAVGPNLLEIIANPYIIFGMASYFLGMLSLMAALKNEHLNVVYPFVALSYVWVSIMAMYFLHEIITSLQWLGILSIVFGVSFIGVGSE